MSRMEIDKAHRGLGLGLLAVLAAIKLAEVQVVFCKPFPLERDEKEPKKILDSRIDKLASHWKKLGFCEIGTKRNRWLGLSTAFRLPTLDELKQEGHIKI